MGQYLACGEDSSYLPLPAPVCAVELIVQYTVLQMNQDHLYHRNGAGEGGSVLVVRYLWESVIRNKSKLEL